MYAAFAVNQLDNNIKVWLLEDDECWSDIVRGDGASYRPATQNYEYPHEGETRQDFEARVEGIVQHWNYDN